MDGRGNHVDVTVGRIRGLGGSASSRCTSLITLRPFVGTAEPPLAAREVTLPAAEAAALVPGAAILAGCFARIALCICGSEAAIAGGFDFGTRCA